MAKKNNANSIKKPKLGSNLSTTKTKTPTTYTTKSSSRTNTSTSKPKATTNNLSSSTKNVNAKTSTSKTNASTSKPKATTNNVSSSTKKTTMSTSKPGASLASLTSTTKAAQQKANAAALAKQEAAAKAAEAQRQAELAAQKKAAEEARQRQIATQTKNNSDYFSKLASAQQGYAGSGLGLNSTALLNWYDIFSSPFMNAPFWTSSEKPAGEGSPKTDASAFLSTVGQGVTNMANNVGLGLASAASGGDGSSSAYNTSSGGSSYRGGYSGGGYGGYGSGGGSGSSDDELTDEEKEAAKNQNALAKMNIQDLQNQLNRQLDIYNQADTQNKRLADAERAQASRKAESDRFDAQRNLQAASLALLGDMGQAMNGSATGNLMRMLENRNDLEDNAQLSQLLSNWEQTNNQYNDTLNQNRIARMEAMANTEKAINDATRNWMAALNNIDPSLFPKSGYVNGDASLAASTAWKRKAEGAAPTSSLIAPFVRGDNKGKGGTPQGTANPAQSMNVGYTRNRQLGGDYFSRLINQFNRR